MEYIMNLWDNGYNMKYIYIYRSQIKLPEIIGIIDTVSIPRTVVPWECTVTHICWYVCEVYGINNQIIYDWLKIM